MASSNILKYRIATSEAGLAKGAFFVRRIPPPSLATFQPFFKIVSRSDGGDAAHGYKKVTFTWATLGLTQYYQIKRLVDEVRPGLIYVTFEINDGSSPAGIFVDASGRPGFMQQSSDSAVDRIGQAGVSNATLVINNATILNNPSNYS